MYLIDVGLLLPIMVMLANSEGSLTTSESCFQAQYTLNDFITSSAFKDVTDVAFNHQKKHVLVLQRSYPPVTIWSVDGTLLSQWDTQDIGYPHSLTIQTSNNDSEATIWITDMAGELAAGNKYGHCIKQFTYSGKFIRSIGSCGLDTNGSSLNPLEFDRVTDLALNSEGYIYITDGDIGGANNRILILDPNYSLVDVWNKENKAGSGPLQFNLPHSIYIDWCDRVWITDTNNHRIQIVSHNGKFLDEWKCFNDSLIYGIDIHHKNDESYIFVTAKNTDGQSELLILPMEVNDCSYVTSFGTCTVQRRLVLKDSTSGNTTSAMLHSVAFDDETKTFYVAMLPGLLPPFKLSPVPPPPRNDMSLCPQSSHPDLLPSSWSARPPHS